jgi:hypothetical protein
MNPVVKSALQGAIPTLVLVGGTNLIVKKFRETRPVLYWGSLAVATGVAVAVVQGRIPAPFMNAESLVGQNCKFDDTGYCYTHDRHDCDFSPNFWDADYTDSDLSHFGKPLEHDEEFTTMQVRIGSPSGSTTSWTTAFNLQCIGDEDNLTYFTELLEDEIKSKVRQWNPKTIEDSSSKTTMQIVIGSPSGSTTSWYRAFEVSAHDEMDGEDLSYLSGEIQDLLVDKAKWWNGDEVRYDAETFEARENKDGTIVLTDNEWDSCLHLFNGHYLWGNLELKLIDDGLKNSAKFKKEKIHSYDALQMIYLYERLLSKRKVRGYPSPNKLFDAESFEA